MDYKEKGICSICGSNYEHWGNNAEPVNNGRCCDYCNENVVMLRRIMDIARAKMERKNEVKMNEQSN